MKRCVKRRGELDNNTLCYRGSTLERENPLWHCVKKSIHCGAVSYIMSLRHKKESIRYDTAIERKYQENILCRCVTRRRHPLWSCAKKREYPLCCCDTRRRVSIIWHCVTNRTPHDGAVS